MLVCSLRGCVARSAPCGAEGRTVRAAARSARSQRTFSAAFLPRLPSIATGALLAASAHADIHRARNSLKHCLAIVIVLLHVRPLIASRSVVAAS